MNLPLPWTLLAVALAFAGGALLGEADGARRADARWTADVVRRHALDEAAARAVEISRYRNMEVAYRANQQENQRLRLAAARAARAAAGLRDDLAAVRAAVRLSAEPGPAGAAALAACHAVLGDCGERYRGLAQVADDHAADVRLCLDGWPR